MRKDAPSGGVHEKLEPDQVLTAVVVADSFNHRFMPLTLEKPRCLLPLLNVPLIEYTLEFLALSGVDEILVVCCAHADEIKRYLARSPRWGTKSSVPRVSTFVSQELKSVGDALRDLDAKQVLKSDFILVSGDVVSNMNLQQALEEHRNRRLTDKNSIMTMVLKSASPSHRTRSRGEEGIYVLDSVTRQCVHYDSVYPKKRKLKISTELFKAHPELKVRNDLIDCQIDICSIDVPALFTENFDWQDIRRHFVRGILESDLLGKTIYCHIISSKYSARVRSTQMYDSISKDMIARWTFPMVPDGNITGDLSYTHSSPHIYKEKNVVLSRSTVLDRHVAVGSQTQIGESTSIANSVIGRRCKIGNNVTIEGSYIWDDTVIEDNCRVHRSILAENVRLRRGVQVGTGSILSYGVVIGENFSVPPFARITKKRHVQRDSDDESSDVEEDASATVFLPEIVGDGGEGLPFVSEFSDDEDEENDRALLELCSMARDAPIEDIDDVADDDSDDSDFDTDVDDESKWRREIQLTFERGIRENLTTDDVFVELNPLKFAHNLSFHQIREEAIPTFLNLVSPTLSVDNLFARWGEVFQKLVFDEKDQLDLLQILEEHCMEHENHGKLILHILKALYQREVVEDDAISAWYASSKGPIRDAAKPFVDWLQQDDEDDEDDEDEE
ncbi:putative translation initiation factor eIF-2B subunit epsilon [Zopfochytrium polystomum]|nr:putative translation initiation factor eIF-2B subunit epsilon [Zopfochytrium polystomum]